MPLPGIVTELLKRPIDHDEFIFLKHTTGIPWCMRARLINKFRREFRKQVSSDVKGS